MSTLPKNPVYLLINNEIVTLYVDISQVFKTREEAEQAMKPKQFEVGKHYKWVKDIPLGINRNTNDFKCVYVGNYQVVLENTNGLYLYPKSLLTDNKVKPYENNG